MEILSAPLIFESQSLIKLMISLVSAFSYTQIVYGFTSDFEATNKKRNAHIICWTYFAVILTIDVVFTILGWEVYANYIYVGLTSIFIGRYKQLGYLKGFSFALTILACFQWIVVFTGSLAFLVIPYDWLVDNSLYLMMLYGAHLAAALLLYKFRLAVFKLDTGKKLLLIDIGAKIFFIAFFNLIFPNYFETLGMVNYATLALVLLLTAFIFTVYREYSIFLEKKLAVYNANQFAVLRQAMQTIAKYEGTISANNIDSTENPIVQALIYELIASCDRLGISINVSVSGNTATINLSNYELHTIINEFIENALEEVQTHTDKALDIVTDCTDGIFTFKLCVAVSSNNKPLGSLRIEKDAAISRMEKNGNITISISRTNGFTQILRVTC